MSTLPVAVLNTITRIGPAYDPPAALSDDLPDHLSITGDEGRVYLAIRGQEIALTRKEACAVIDHLCEAIHDAGT